MFSSIDFKPNNYILILKIILINMKFLMLSLFSWIAWWRGALQLPISLLPFHLLAYWIWCVFKHPSYRWMINRHVYNVFGWGSFKGSFFIFSNKLAWLLSIFCCLACVYTLCWRCAWCNGYHCSCGHGELSSNPGQGCCVSLHTNTIKKSMNPFHLSQLRVNSRAD